MMNVGIDIIETSRIIALAQDKNKLSKVFTQNEIDYFNKFRNCFSHISGNFCAKEAFVKALKVGFSKGLSPKDIEVLHNDGGAPYINLQNSKIKKFLPPHAKVDLSISHSDTIATAICIIYFE